MIKEIGSDLRTPLKTWISSQLLRCGKNSLLTYHPYAARRNFFPCLAFGRTLGFLRYPYETATLIGLAQGGGHYTGLFNILIY